jgi:peptidoglycan/LPS O-acetylase OafA/YrhL
MSMLTLPRVEYLSATNLCPGHSHAIMISAIRALAAMQVLAAHLRAQLYPGLATLTEPSLWYQGLAFFTGFAHQAVVAFFVLSGWLVGGSLLNKLGQPRPVLAYAIDRVTRLWIVLVPSFLLSLAIAAFAGAVDPGRICYEPDNEYSMTAFAGNLLGLQDMAVPRFGGNFSLWSLANEVWYYVLFPLLVLLSYAGSILIRMFAALLAVGLMMLLEFQIVLYFTIWLAGVAFSRIRLHATRFWRWTMIVALGAMSVYYRLYGSNDILVPESYVQDLLISVGMLAILSSFQFKADATRWWVRAATTVGGHFAAYSFTLYVIHKPLLSAIRSLHEPISRQKLSPEDPSSLITYAVILVGITYLSYLFHLPFEAQTHRLRSAIKRIFKEKSHLLARWAQVWRRANRITGP